MRTERGKYLPKEFESDVRVQYERLTDRYFICMSAEIAARGPETQGRPNGEQSAEMEVEDETVKHIAAIDPGIRTFATLYDPGRRQIVEWGMHGGRKDGKHGGTELLGWLTRDRQAREGGQAGAWQAQAEDQAANQGPDCRDAPQVGPLAVPELLGRAAAQVQRQGDLEAQGPPRGQEARHLQERRPQAGPDVPLHVSSVPPAQGARVWHASVHLRRVLHEQDVHPLRYPQPRSGCLQDVCLPVVLRDVRPRRWRPAEHPPPLHLLTNQATLHHGETSVLSYMSQGFCSLDSCPGPKGSV